jgi:hypothetical protein
MIARREIIDCGTILLAIVFAWAAGFTCGRGL